jgi:hypothetical protein
MNGDFIGHDIIASEGASKSHWDIQKTVFETIQGKVLEKFPSIPVLPSIGNNDVLFHY